MVKILGQNIRGNNATGATGDAGGEGLQSLQ